MADADADALREGGAPNRLSASSATAGQSVLPALANPPLTPPPSATPPPAGEEKGMTLVDHLSELRRRIFICVTAVVADSLVRFIFVGRIIAILREPLGV